MLTEALRSNIFNFRSVLQNSFEALMVKILKLCSVFPNYFTIHCIYPVIKTKEYKIRFDSLNVCNSIGKCNYYVSEVYRNIWAE